eukprot:15098816-Alexandrium_andersonii.AAC.1
MPFRLTAFGLRSADCPKPSLRPRGRQRGGWMPTTSEAVCRALLGSRACGGVWTRCSGIVRTRGRARRRPGATAAG